MKIRLVDPGKKRIAVIKAVRVATGLSLVEAKRLVDRCPVDIEVRNYTLEELLEELAECGAAVEVSKTPECDRMGAVRDMSQGIGEFLDWLRNRGIHLAEYRALTDVLPSGREVVRPEELVPYSYTTEKLLAEYFEIDLDKVEAERRMLLEELRKSQ